ncbi:nucleotidyltransferase family protein [Streptomyces sp. NPDC048161]|uniref:nucleotidyltransferase family protein n=1 Tax=unclassified Streptomyces TaxID=2593676 RepID=UPI00340402ED
MISRLPLDQQLESLRVVLSRNDMLTEVLSRAATLELPGWYVTAGCLFQTVWNVVTGRPPTNGIKDYDLFYFDSGDLSWEAEDTVIKTGRKAFAGLPTEVEIRNEARVHLWYQDKFGVPCPPLVVRPNPVLAPRTVYEAKAARWREQWPELTVLDWPSTSVMSASSVD